MSTVGLGKGNFWEEGGVNESLRAVAPLLPYVGSMSSP